MKRKLRSLVLSTVTWLLPTIALAQAPKTNYNIGLGTRSPEEVVVNIINWILGILALFAVIFILYGGFMWMTAAGNDDRVGTAKKILTAAIIGLVIILAAWGISIYALNILGTATQ